MGMTDSSKPRIVATVECRMNSSRLPGKVLLRADGKSMLEILAERVSQVPKIDTIVFATTENPIDDAIETLARDIGVGCFRGSEEDVLKRVLLAARSVQAEIIVELTGDNPLVDPELISQAIDTFIANDVDYLHNRHVPGYPSGMDTQIFWTRCLEMAERDGREPADREHVSWYFRRKPELFKQLFLQPPPALRRPDIRLTLDEEPDYRLIRTVYEHLSRKGRTFDCYDIIEFLDGNPDLLKLNSHVIQRQVSSNA